MTPEGQKPSETLRDIALIGGLILIAHLAFGRPVRRAILERDKVDVWDGSTDRLEAAHINHDRSDPRYNDASNGRLLTTKHHYLDHYNRAGRNGLTVQANNWALRSIWARLTEEERVGLPPPPEE